MRFDAGDLAPILTAMKNPRSLVQLDAQGWTELLAQARKSGLLLRLAELSQSPDVKSEIPEKASVALFEAQVFMRRNQTNLQFEANRLTHALQRMSVPVVVLKGGAYLLAELPLAQRRFATDLDIMVPRDKIEDVERALISAGWRTQDVSAYDDTYYRKWMHEIPPMWHPDRLIAVDIHHTIAPVVSRYRPDARSLFAAARSLDDARYKVLCPADMVLHATLHFFSEEVFAGLRDLADLSDLLSHYGAEDDFWATLIERARLHGLERPLFYLVRYTQIVFSRSFPREFLADVELFAPSRFVLGLMDWLILSALLIEPQGPKRWQKAAALTGLQIRSHWIKMPPALLAQHLARKMLIRLGTLMNPAKFKKSNSQGA